MIILYAGCIHTYVVEMHTDRLLLNLPVALYRLFQILNFCIR